jgi:hypothetical protein
MSQLTKEYFEQYINDVTSKLVTKDEFRDVTSKLVNKEYFDKRLDEEIEGLAAMVARGFDDVQRRLGCKSWKKICQKLKGR